MLPRHAKAPPHGPDRAARRDWTLAHRWAQRHLWLVDTCCAGCAATGAGDDPRRRRGPGAACCSTRVQARPEWQARWQRWWRCFTDTVDPAPLLADFGFAPRTALLQRARATGCASKLLPATPEPRTTWPRCSTCCCPTRATRTGCGAATATLRRLSTCWTASGTVARGASATTSGARRAAGRADVLRQPDQRRRLLVRDPLRMRTTCTATPPFPPAWPPLGQCEALQGRCLARGARRPAGAGRRQALRAQLDACRHAAYTVYAHLEEHGISVDIVFRLRQLRERVLRIRATAGLPAVDHASPARQRAPAGPPGAGRPGPAQHPRAVRQQLRT